MQYAYIATCLIIAIAIPVYGYHHDLIFMEFIDELFLERVRAALHIMNINWLL